MSEAYYKPCKELAINTMVREISSVLSDCEPSSKDEYANFVEDTIQLVVKQFAEKKLV